MPEVSPTDLRLLDPNGQFAGRLRSDHATLAQAAIALASGQSAALLVEIEPLAHRLAGAAGTFGYTAISDAALTLDEMLADRRKGHATPDAAIAKALHDLVAALQAAL